MKDKYTVAWKRIFQITLILICSILFFDFIRRAAFGSSGGTIIIMGKFKNSTLVSGISPNTEMANDPQNPTSSGIEVEKYSGFAPVNIKADEYLGKGSLTVINSQHISQDIYMGLSDLSSDINYSEYYSVNNYQMFISQEVIPHLNDMMRDYNSATGKNNIVIYNTTSLSEDSLYSTDYPEAVSGYSFDIAVISSSGDVIQYDGMDTESWIIQNCYNYGFVLRYPEGSELQTGFEYSPYHLRYVGVPHSLIMNEKNMCLEEYAEYLKNYTYDNPLVYNSAEGLEYTIYYAPLVSAETPVNVPVSGDYQISGNNYDGYIIYYCK